MSSPVETLLEIQKESGFDISSESFAKLMDSKDELKSFRNEFFIPQHEGKDAIYVCGNSLGLQPKNAREYVREEMEKWGEMGVEGHFRGVRPWAENAERVTGYSAEVVGAKESEVAVMNSLSVNIHILLLTFYKPTNVRYKIIMEDFAFCSDQHIIHSQLVLNGRTLDDLVLVKPRLNEHHIRTEDILSAINTHSDSLALVFFSGVHFYTGQAFDLKTIVAEGHKCGAVVGFDLAHAVGNILLQLHEWNVDFAAWCSYKYMNSGPGSIAGIFVHENHASKKPALAGWWGQEPSVRFKMLGSHEPKLGAQGYQLSNPASLPSVCLEASLDLFHRAGMINLRRKSELLTGYLEHLLAPLSTIDIITPKEASMRGCQLSLLFDESICLTVHKFLEDQGIIADLRRPNVIRIAPTPLYNSFEDIRKLVQSLKHILNKL